jgi:hypothetical protein
MRPTRTLARRFRLIKLRDDQPRHFPAIPIAAIPVIAFPVIAFPVIAFPVIAFPVIAFPVIPFPSSRSRHPVPVIPFPSSRRRPGSIGFCFCVSTGRTKVKMDPGLRRDDGTKA